jgi:hypothetical protein
MWADTGRIDQERGVGVLLGEDVPQTVDGHRVGQVSARTGEIAVGGQCGHRLVIHAPPARGRGAPCATRIVTDEWAGAIANQALPDRRRNPDCVRRRLHPRQRSRSHGAAVPERSGAAALSLGSA